MFTLTIDGDTTITTMEFNDYNIAIGMYYSFLGSALIQKEDKDFCLTIGNTIIRQTEITEGKIDYDFSMFW